MCRKTIVIAYIIILVAYSCSSSRVMVSEATPENHPAREYIEKYSAIAISEMKRTGVPASIKLAQGMIESDFGRSRLARTANNHFGVKCHSTWKGPVIYHHDDALDECFRKYSDPEQSFRDHSDFLVSGSRYRSLFSLNPTDYKGWARGLKSAGYATNPSYADMLIAKIEANGLTAFDRGYAGVPVRPAPGTVQRGTQGSTRPAGSLSAPARGSRYSQAVAGRVMKTNRVDYIVVNETDTYESIRNDFDLLSWELEKYNEELSQTPLQPGQVICLQPKRKRAEPGIRYHVVREGETMYRISQLYAIRLSNLYRMNFMDEGSQPATGRKINLR
jgi:LysM repeat protein